jgi:hypothetical protein
MLRIPSEPPRSSSERAALERPASPPNPTLSYFLTGWLWFLAGFVSLGVAIAATFCSFRPPLTLWGKLALPFSSGTGLLGELLFLGGFLFWVVGFARLFWAKKAQETSKIPQSQAAQQRRIVAALAICWGCWGGRILILAIVYDLLAILVLSLAWRFAW